MIARVIMVILCYNTLKGGGLLWKLKVWKI